MTLNLTITNPNVDYGRYHCVSKNEVGITRGEIDVYGEYFIAFPWALCNKFKDNLTIRLKKEENRLDRHRRRSNRHSFVPLKRSIT